MNEPYIYIASLLLIEALLYILVKRRVKFRETLEKHGVDVRFLSITVDLGNASRLRRASSLSRGSVKRIIFIAGISNMAFLVAYLYFILVGSLRSVFTAISTGGTPTSPFIPIIPGVTIELNVLPSLLVFIGIAIAIHELMHAVVALIEGVKVDSWGIGVFAIFPLAYVKPSETSFNEASRRSRLSILSAGILGNSLVALLALAIISLLSQQVTVVPVIIDLDRSNASLPAVQANISTPSIILEVNGSKITRLSSFISLLSELSNESSVIVLKTHRCVIEGYRVVETDVTDIYVLHKPAGSKLGVYLNELISSTTPTYVVDTLIYMNWFFVVNLSLALINAAPLFITDGGRITTEVLSRVSAKANFLVQGATSLSIATLLIIGLLNSLTSPPP
ncbi:MAG: site-2 protease family protein [Zestosphaera sp.]